MFDVQQGTPDIVCRRRAFTSSSVLRVSCCRCLPMILRFEGQTPVMLRQSRTS